MSSRWTVRAFCSAIDSHKTRKATRQQRRQNETDSQRLYCVSCDIAGDSSTFVPSHGPVRQSFSGLHPISVFPLTHFSSVFPKYLRRQAGKPIVFSFWLSGTLALNPGRQSALKSKTINGRLASLAMNPLLTVPILELRENGLTLWMIDIAQRDHCD